MSKQIRGQINTKLEEQEEKLFKRNELEAQKSVKQYQAFQCICNWNPRRKHKQERGKICEQGWPPKNPRLVNNITLCIQKCNELQIT